MTDLLFVHRARHENADREIAELTASHEHSRFRVTARSDSKVVDYQIAGSQWVTA